MGKVFEKSGGLIPARFTSGYRIAICIPVFLFFQLAAIAQDNALSWRNNLAYNSYLMREVHAQYANREVKFKSALSSSKAMELYREQRRKSYRSIIGDFPEKTPLNAKVSGTQRHDGFSIEKVIYESVPGRFVSANFYIPGGNGPFPGILLLAGHGMSGKASEQRAALTLVQNGFAVFAVDPVGQGERVQLLDTNGKTATRGSTTEHTLLNAGANLVGTSVAAIEYWDNHRALDYLETRKEVDKNKLGCIGSSGGGTQATYMLGMDDRIKVAVVCSYVSKRERVLELSGPSDGCQHIPYEGREGLEIGDFLLMFSPKPLLIMSGLYDFVDYWGAQQTYQELQAAYKVLGNENKVSMFTVESGHGMPKPKREAATAWFRKWFYQDNQPVSEKAGTPIPEKELWTTASGQVLTNISEAVSTPKENQNISEELARQRSIFLKKDAVTIKSKVNELLGLKPLTDKIVVEATGSISARNHTINKYQILRKGEMPVPVVLVYPENANAKSRVVVLLNENGKSEILSNEKMLEPYINRGDILLLADLRGIGETADPLDLNDTKYWNKEYRNAMISMHAGRPVMGQRVTDIISVMDFVQSDEKLKGRRLNLQANGVYGPAAIHAAYLDSRISTTEISRSFRSFEDMVRYSMQRDVYSNVLYGVLKYYDLKDLMTGGNRIRFVD